MEEKKNKKSLKIIIIIIVILLILAIAGGIFLFINNKKSIGTEWGDVYFEYLEDKISDNDYKDAKNGKLQFIQLEDENKPAMILSYEKDTDKFMEITLIDKENKTKTKKIEAKDIEELDIELLYNIKNEKYDWYEHQKKEDGSELFVEIEESYIKNNSEPEDDKKYEFTEEELKSEKESPSISKFDEEFIKPEFEENETDIDLKGKIDKKELRDTVKKAVDKYKTQDKIITDEVKEEVEKSLEELENLKEQINQTKDTEDGILVGENLLKFGQYKGNGEIDSKYTLVINQDKTYKMTIPWSEGTKEGSVTVEYDEVTGQYWVVFGDDYSGIVTKEGNILSQSEVDFYYEGNIEKTTTSETKEENEKQQTTQETEKQNQETQVNSSETAEKTKQALEEEQKKLDETNKQIFNIQFTSYEGKQTGTTVKSVLNTVISSNSINSNKVTVEMDGVSSADSSQITSLKNKVATAKNYQISLEYDSNGYINKIIIK